MSTWVIVSWVCVFIMTAINVVLFLKLKDASEKMMKMVFPGAKNMQEAMGKMQQMMGSMGGRGGFRGGAQDAQLKAAMDMLNKMQKR